MSTSSRGKQPRRKPLVNQTSTIPEARRLFKDGHREASSQLLRDFLRSNPKQIEAMLWLGKVSPDKREALAAAELALALEPENEIAQRAVAALQTGPQIETSGQTQIEIMRVTGMTLSQARAVIWPYRGLQRPMGVLLDEGLIKPKDLAWAFQEVDNSVIKQAAHTLLLTFLFRDQLKEPVPPLKVIEGEDYAGFQERRSLAIWGLLNGSSASTFLLGIIAWFVGLYLGLAGSTYYIIAFFVSLLLFGMCYVTFRASDRYLDTSEQFKLGRNAENRVIDALRASLNSPWVLIHNLEWPNRDWGDVDLVLIGTGGIWTLEVKAYTSPTRNLGGRWEYKSRWGWRQLSKHPGKQSTRNAVRVKEYLEANGAGVGYVQPVVLWAGDEELLSLQDPQVPVWILSEMPDRLEDLWRKQRLSEDKVHQCVTVLSEVMEKMKAKSAAARDESNKKGSA